MTKHESDRRIVLAMACAVIALLLVLLSFVPVRTTASETPRLLTSSLGISVFEVPVISLLSPSYEGTRSAERAVFLTEEFENGGALPPGWSIATVGRAWEMTTDSARYGSICGAGDYAAVCDSDLAGSGVPVDSWIKSPVIDCSAGSNIYLSFYHRYDWFSETSAEGIYVYVANDGSVDAADALVYHQYTADIPLEELELNISSYADGSPSVQIGWRYVAEYDYWWIIDTVTVEEYTPPPPPPPPPPTFFSEDFEAGGAIPPGWSTSFTGRNWEATTDSARYDIICGAGDYAMVCDSDLAGSGVPVDAWLKSPVIDCSNREFIELVFDQKYNWYSEGSSEGCFIYVAADGSVDAADALVYHEYTADIPLETRRINISSIADKKPAVQLGFRYVANYDYWWIVDDVLLQGYIADKTPPAQVDTLTGTAGDSQVSLDWTGYDEAGQGDVAAYRIYHDLSPISDVTGMTPISEVSNGTFQHTVLELRNGIDHYFAVTAIDEVPNENKSVIGIGPLMPLPRKTVSITLTAGWNLISIPVITDNTSITSVLSSIAGQWDRALYYDVSNPSAPWKQYCIYWNSALNDLTVVDHTMALWLRATAPCTLVVEGAVPEAPNIPLQPGWNLVGYPSMSTSTTISEALAGIPYDYVEGYDPNATYLTSVLSGSYVMQAGEGYWVHCTGTASWTMTNDVLAPIVNATSPADGAVNVPVGSTINITFSEAMDHASTEAAFSINPSVAGTFSWDPTDTVMTFTPSSPLTGGPTTYTVTVNKGAMDTSLNKMPWNETFTFTTVDLTPPTVVSTDPTDGEVDVPPGDNIVITFSEAMNHTATEAAFSINPSTTGTFSWNPADTVMTFDPSASLALLTTYTVTIGTGAMDLAGNNLQSPYSFSFTTSSDPVEKHAIIVGISDYQFISDLSYCDEDATDWYNYLIGLGYTCEIYGDGPAATSSYPIYTDDATEAIVRAAIQNKVAALTSNDYFVYATSGHGDGDGFGSSYLCQWDCSGSAGCYYDTE
ncbi:MAG: Ig-like domain-containing protein, partial [Candidatus Thermoplasmatota archaeon]